MDNTNTTIGKNAEEVLGRGKTLCLDSRYPSSSQFHSHMNLEFKLKRDYSSSYTYKMHLSKGEIFPSSEASIDYSVKGFINIAPFNLKDSYGPMAMDNRHRKSSKIVEIDLINTDETKYPFQLDLSESAKPFGDRWMNELFPHAHIFGQITMLATSLPLPASTSKFDIAMMLKTAVYSDMQKLSLATDAFCNAYGQGMEKYASTYPLKARS